MRLILQHYNKQNKIYPQTSSLHTHTHTHTHRVAKKRVCLPAKSILCLSMDVLDVIGRLGRWSEGGVGDCKKTIKINPYPICLYLIYVIICTYNNMWMVIYITMYDNKYTNIWTYIYSSKFTTYYLTWNLSLNGSDSLDLLS